MPGIKQYGIKKGMIPDIQNHRLLMKRGYQWLTCNSEFSQSWNEYSSSPYDRTGLRLTIKIPGKRVSQLFKWVDVCKVLTSMCDTLNAYGDPENWYLFHGTIPPTWMIQIDEKPILASQGVQSNG